MSKGNPVKTVTLSPGMAVITFLFVACGFWQTWVDLTSGNTWFLFEFLNWAWDLLLELTGRVREE